MLSDEIQGSESITRFARHSNEYSAATKRIKHSLFMPPHSMRLSVFRTSDLSESEVWPIGDRIVFKGARQAQARADLAAGQFREVELEVEPEPTPHPAHAEVVGWPKDKPEQIAAAKELAVKASLVLREPT